MTNPGRPAAGEFDPYYQRYISLVTEGDEIAGLLDAQSVETERLLRDISEEQAASRYAEGKWSIKQLVGHVVDAERVFAYRALAIGRGETRPLPSFDEQAWGDTARADARPFADLVEELATVRRSTVMMMRAFDEEAWQRRGVANDQPVTPRALAYIMLGHERHHMRVLRERYLGAGTPQERKA